MAKLTFTAPFVGQSTVSARVQVIASLDLQKSKMTVALRLKAAGGSNQPADASVSIANGSCDTLIASAAVPAGYDFGSTNVPTGFDQCWAAVRGASAGNEEAALLGALVTIGVLPAGVVS